MLISLRSPSRRQENLTHEEKEFLKDLFFDIRTLKLNDGALHIECPDYLTYSIDEDEEKYTDFSINYKTKELMHGTIFKGTKGNLYDIKFLKDNIISVIVALNMPVTSTTIKKSIFSEPITAPAISEQLPTATP